MLGQIITLDYATTSFDPLPPFHVDGSVILSSHVFAALDEHKPTVYDRALKNARSGIRDKDILDVK